MKNFMESLINHFKIYSEGVSINKEEVYSVVEAPKGEFGIFLMSIILIYLIDVELKHQVFYITRIRFYIKRSLLADLVTIIGTLDLVFGEIDR
jgi:NADH:ubiquinone oxidoreductase subunit D